MRAVTIKEAKAHLNDLIEAAVAGEQVVLMRGSKHVAGIVPLTAADLEVSTRLSDDQAARFWEEIAEERRREKVRTFDSAERAVAWLRTTKHRGRPARKRSRR